MRLGGVVPPLGQSEFQQRAIEQLAGIVAEKGPPRTVGAFEAGREPDDQEPRALWSE